MCKLIYVERILFLIALNIIQIAELSFYSFYSYLLFKHFFTLSNRHFRTVMLQQALCRARRVCRIKRSSIRVDGWLDNYYFYIIDWFSIPNAVCHRENRLKPLFRATETACTQQWSIKRVNDDDRHFTLKSKKTVEALDVRGHKQQAEILTKRCIISCCTLIHK